MFKKIAVAFDESPEAEHAFRSALDLARLVAGELYLITVIENQPAYMSYVSAVAPEVPLLLKNQKQAFYEDLFQKVTQTSEYKDYMEKQALKPIFLTGKDMLKFLEEDDKLNTSLMNEAGFVAK